MNPRGAVIEAESSAGSLIDRNVDPIRHPGVRPFGERPRQQHLVDATDQTVLGDGQPLIDRIEPGQESLEIGPHRGHGDPEGPHVVTERLDVWAPRERRGPRGQDRRSRRLAIP